MRTLSAEQHLDPARSIIARLGGVDAVARVTGRDRTRVFRWMYSEAKGGTGGRIPMQQIPKLLKFAARRGKRLQHADFFNAG
jgi:hypothetical protein